MTFDITEIYKHLSLFFWCFTRIGAAIMIMPVFGTKMLPTRIRLMLVLSLTIVNLPYCNNCAQAEFLSLDSLLILAQQFIIGIAIGFVLQLIFQVY